MDVDIAVPTEEGYWVSEKYARISEIIKDIDDTLELGWIPPNRRAFHDAPPFAVICRPRGGKPYVVFTVMENELDERVIAKILRGRDISLSALEASDRAREALKLKEQLERAEARQDFVKTVVGSPLHSFRHNGKIIPK